MYDLEILNNLRLEKGWPVLELARRAKVPQSTLQGMFRRGSGHPETIRKVGKVFKLTLKQLIKKNAA